jgi:very-short-patch-repair endonuclease
MTRHFNTKEMKEVRRYLRANMTYCEKIVWMYLRKKQMGVKFRRQHSIDNYVIDFYCPRLKLAVEIDGDVHDLPYKRKYDKERQNHIEKYGIRFLRITNEELLGNPNKAFERIEKEINILERK